MELYLLRHGAAEARAARDQDRQLTAEGRQYLLQSLAQRSNDLSQVSQIACSPYVRTRQTLDVACEAVPALSLIRPHFTEALIPGGCPQSVIDWLAEVESSSVLLITHQPFVGALLDSLCGFQAGRHFMNTGSLAAIDFDVVAKGLGVLRWLR